MDVKIVKNFVNGNWAQPDCVGYEDIKNPSTGEVIGKVPLSSVNDVEKAIEAANNAYQQWRSVPVATRCKYLFRLQNLIVENFDDLSSVISLEEGKNLLDARAEMKRVLQNVEVACGMPTIIQGEKLEGTAPDIDTEVIRQPLGVFGIIAPFNFPAMVPFWFLPYAIAAGNTIVIKASKQVPLTMQKIFGLFEKIGLPSGVVNLVNGDKAVSDILLQSPFVKGISFVGSTNVAKKIAIECAMANKRFQALGSAKNYFVVMQDAKLDMVVSSLLTSCYGCAGERCMAASVVAAVPKIYDELKEMFIEAAKKLKVGNPLEAGVDVGPVISASAKNKILEYIDIGIREGAKLVLDGRNISLPDELKNGYYIGPTIFSDVTPDMTIAREEIFGPVVCMIKVDSLDEALKQIKEHKYGNGASIFTQNGYYARKFQVEANVGMVGINIGIPAPVAYFPFGGVKESMYGDIKAQGKGIVDFFTEKKITTVRFYAED